MQRTQIYLANSQLTKLQELARKQSITVSELIRQCVQEQLQGKTNKSRREKETLLDAAKRIGKLGRKAPSDLASNMDKYLYG